MFDTGTQADPRQALGDLAYGCPQQRLAAVNRAIAAITAGGGPVPTELRGHARILEAEVLEGWFDNVPV